MRNRNAKRILAALLASAMLLSTVPALALEDGSADALDTVADALVTGSSVKQDGATAVNLSDEGNMDWIYVDGAGGTATFDRKAQAAPFITNVNLMASDSANDQSEFRMSYVGGANTASVTDGRHMGIYQNGTKNVVSFDVPGSLTERTVRIYNGSWYSENKVTVSINEVEQYTETFGKSTNEEGGYYYISTINYHTESADDVVTISMTMTALGEWGNMNLSAVTLEDENYVEQLVSGGSVKQDGAVSVDLSEEGNMDWLYVDGAGSTSAFDRKKQDAPFITNVDLLASSSANDQSDFRMSYSDGTNNTSVTDGRHMAIYDGGSKQVLSFDVPGSLTERTVKLYGGSWNSQVELSVSIGGVEQYTETFGKNESSSGGWYYISTVNYHTKSASDVVTISLATTADTQGNMNLSAVTLHDANYVAPEPPSDDPIYARNIKALPTGTVVNMTSEGSAYWQYFTQAAVEKKDVEPIAVITEQPGMSGSIAGDKMVVYNFTDGSGPENNASTAINEKRGRMYPHVGSGFTLSLPGSTQKRTLNLYIGCYSATYDVKVFKNEEETPVLTKTYTNGSPTNISLFSMDYQTEESDTLTVAVRVNTVTDPTYGAIIFQAMTVSGDPVIVDHSGEVLSNDAVSLSHPNGKIRELNFTDKNGKTVDIPFSKFSGSDGPAWSVDGQTLRLKKSDESEHTYSVTQDGVTYKMDYSVTEDGVLNVAATLQNNTDAAFTPQRASVVMGLNTYMEDKYEDYKDLFFPTLLRCEKNYMWGYFESPSGNLLSFAADAPVSSYRLNYESGAHRIYTVTLDLMQQDETLPARHPQGNATLAAGDSRTWNLKFKLSDGIDSVKPDIASLIGAPMLDADVYTVGEGESANLRVYSPVDIASITVDKLDNGNAPNIRSKDGEANTLTTTYTPCDPVALVKSADGCYTAQFAPPSGVGVYRLTVTGKDGYQSEGMITLRNSWSWYMKSAMESALTHVPRGVDCCESYYSAFSFYLGQKYFDLPEEEVTNFDDNYFRDVYDVINYKNGVPSTNAPRIQNHSTVISQLVDRYEAGIGDKASLKDAAKIADYIISRQNKDGAYIGPSGDYTSVIYPAQSIMELMYCEKAIVDAGEDEDGFFEAIYDKQYDSVKKAMDNLVRLDGDLHTEGQLTFEDGAFSCSASQLSEFALMHDAGTPERLTYQTSAEEYLRKHDALEQMLIPDSRMNGASLRFWEAQYDTLVNSSPNNMLNSPHGWSAWNIYGLFNLYELTGKLDYLERGMSAMGTCAQLMGFDGNLYWGFIADPYIEASQFVQKPGDTSQYGEGQRRNVTIGETYVDMISDWWLAEPGTHVGGYYGQGGTCDNDVHEIFKVMEADVLTKAYVVEQADGSLTAYNCDAQKQDGILVITTRTDELTNQISLNLVSSSAYSVVFPDGKTKAGTAASGMTTVTAQGAVADTTAPTQPSSLKANEVTQTEATLTWTASTDDVGVTGYEVSLGTAAKEVVTATTFRFTGLTANMEYTAKVVAKDAAGNRSEAATVTFKTLETVTPPDPTVKHTVTFNANGGSAVASVQVESGKTLTKPSDPTRSNYRFAGWFTDEALTMAYDFTKPVTADLTLYASWNKKSSGGDSGSTGGNTGGTTTQPGGTTTTETTKPDGSKEITVVNKDTGETTVTTKAVDGSQSTVKTDKDGKVTAEVTLSSKTEDKATLPMPSVKPSTSAATAPSVTIKSDKAMTVTIPVTEKSDSVVAILVGADGKETILPKAAMGENGLLVPVSGQTTIKLVDNQKSFDDVNSSNWAKSAVDFVASRELFTGTSATSFSPNEKMTRGMLVTVLWRYESKPAGGTAAFGDVASDAYYAEAVAWASSKNIVTGTGTGYNPNGDITREQFATILYRYAGSPATAGMADKEFTDSAKVSSYASDAMRWAVSEGIISGKNGNLLAPQDSATRAEVAAMMERFAKAMT